MKKAIWIAIAVLAGLAGLIMLTGQWQFASTVPSERAKITVTFLRVAGVLWLVIAAACLRSAFRQQSAFALLKSVTPEDRLDAVRRLARLAGRRIPNAFEALDRAAVDVDDSVRHAAMLAIEDLQRTLGALPLTPIPDLKRLHELTRELLSSNVQQQRLAAEQARKLGDPWLYQAGIQVRTAVRHADGDTRARAMRGLGYLLDPLHLDYLQVALGDDDPGVRVEAEAALDRIRSRARPDESAMAWLDA
jgi:HEAT repeat protein